MEIRKFVLSGVLMMFLSVAGNAQQKYVQSDGPAFDGYDLVSYFAGAKPLPGIQKYGVKYDGLTLLFANMANMQEFKRQPDKYLPAYGGYCATAVSNQSLVVPNFANFDIQNDKLLFFETKGFFNGRTEWNKDPQLNEILADRHYRQTFKEGNK